MSKKSITVIIAGRSYPLTVEEQEIEKIQQATQDINQAIKVLQESYAVRDMQDLLAMTSLQLSVHDRSQPQVAVDYTEIERELEALSKEFEQPTETADNKPFHEE